MQYYQFIRKLSVLALSISGALTLNVYADNTSAKNNGHALMDSLYGKNNFDPNAEDPCWNYTPRLNNKSKITYCMEIHQIDVIKENGKEDFYLFTKSDDLRSGKYADKVKADTPGMIGAAVFKNYTNNTNPFFTGIQAIPAGYWGSVDIDSVTLQRLNSQVQADYGWLYKGGEDAQGFSVDITKLFVVDESSIRDILQLRSLKHNSFLYEIDVDNKKPSNPFYPIKISKISLNHNAEKIAEFDNIVLKINPQLQLYGDIPANKKGVREVDDFFIGRELKIFNTPPEKPIKASSDASFNTQINAILAWLENKYIPKDQVATLLNTHSTGSTGYTFYSSKKPYELVQPDNYNKLPSPLTTTALFPSDEPYYELTLKYFREIQEMIKSQGDVNFYQLPMGHRAIEKKYLVKDSFYEFSLFRSFNTEDDSQILGICISSKPKIDDPEYDLTESANYKCYQFNVQQGKAHLVSNWSAG